MTLTLLQKRNQVPSYYNNIHIQDEKDESFYNQSTENLIKLDIDYPENRQTEIPNSELILRTGS